MPGQGKGARGAPRLAVRACLGAGAVAALALTAAGCATRAAETAAAAAAPAPATSTSAPSSISGSAQPVSPPAAGPAAGPAAAPVAASTPALRAEPGLYRCELQRRVLVRRVDDARGALVLSWQGRDHAMQAVPARTGALRFEESPRGGLTWLVIAGKSMLLDSKRQAQLANECTL